MRYPRRPFNLDNAVVEVSYQIDDVTYTREVFASYPDRVIVIRLTADRPGRISFIVRQRAYLRASMHA